MMRRRSVASSTAAESVAGMHSWRGRRIENCLLRSAAPLRVCELVVVRMSNERGAVTRFSLRFLVAETS